MCYTDFITLRNVETPTEPKSGLYLDDLAGISFKNTSEIIEDGLSVSDFINNKVIEACKATVDEALNYTKDGHHFPYLRTNTLSAIYHQKAFNEVVSEVSGEKGISFEMLRPDFYQQSNIVIERIYIKSTVTATISVKIKDGTEEVTISDIDVVAGEVKEINSETDTELPYTAKTKKVELLTDQSGEFYKAVLPYNGCRSCGSRSMPNQTQYLDKNTMIEIKGGHGINAEVHLVCSTDKIGCSIIQYLKYAARLKAGILLATEGKYTNRSNFYAFGSEFDDMIEFYEVEYDIQMRKVIPNLSRLIRLRDSNCFTCGGLKTSTVAF